MRIGIKYAPMNTTPDVMRSVWQVADQAGFDHLWLLDHFLPLTRSATGWYQCDRTDPIFEAWTTLAAMAGMTSRIRIGVNVTGNLYRHPGVLAKMAVTVDHFSGGRLEMGLGAAWAEAEFRMLGIPMPPPGERIDRLSEACQVLKLLWTGNVANFNGQFYTLENAISEPKPVQKPHPPLWIGGAGERKTLRVVAQQADVWNIPGGSPAEAGRLSAVLDTHCEAVGRDPRSIRRSIGLRYDPGRPDELIRQAEELVDRGFNELLVTVIGNDAPQQVETLASRQLAELRSLATVGT